MRLRLAILILLAAAGAAFAQDITGGLNNSPKQLMKGGLNNSFGTITGGGGGVCDGSINLSQGCPQPMLGL